MANLIKRNKKYVLSIGLAFTSGLVLVICIFIASSAKGQIKPYFSGEAINYNDQIFFGTTNTGAFELFTLINERIKKLAFIRPNEIDHDSFYDLIFAKQDNRLLVYLVNGIFLYEYDITDPSSFRLINKVKDNSKDVFYGVGQAGSNIYTVGIKGIKIWNQNLTVINSFKLDIKFEKSLGFSQDGGLLVTTNEGRLTAQDAFYRDLIIDATLHIKKDHNRHPFLDQARGDIFVVDDDNLLNFSLDNSYKKFDHKGNFGYDVDGIQDSAYVYFSDGIGIVKIRKFDMKPVNWAYTTNLGSGNGWSVGLRVVNDSFGEKIIVFNGSSILIFDSQLELIDYYPAQEIGNQPISTLSLKLDSTWGLPGMPLIINGTGYGLNEGLEISLAGQKYYTQTDKYGNFIKEITIPEVKPQNTDIIANGLVSKLSYSISFKIE